MKTFGVAFTVQHWDDEILMSSIDGLSIDAARHIASANTMLIGTARIFSEVEDYTEIYDGGQMVRSGPFAETTFVRVLARQVP